ncbi:MAG: PF20097 family protein [Thermoplasmata archaeon]
MSAGKACPYCGHDLEAGFLTTSNGSGLFWAKTAETTRLRPHGLEVIVGTQFNGTYSANAPGRYCRGCGTIIIQRPK